MKFILFSIISFIITTQMYCQSSWKYPIVPGTSKWATLKSEEEIIAVQQIPESILKKMTTDEVFQAWLDLPGQIEILAFNTLQDGKLFQVLL